MHRRNGHVGPDHTLFLVRGKYWVMSGRIVANQVLRQCFFCRVRRAKQQFPFMADLLTCRAALDQPPFCHCGVDLFGSVYIKQGRKRPKRWILLFTCMTICCVHLEVVEATVTDSITDKQIKQQMKITSLRIRSSSRLLLRLSRTSSRWGVLIMFQCGRLECDSISLLNLIAYIKCDRVTQPLLWRSSRMRFHKCHLRKPTRKLLPDETDLESG